MVDEIPEGEGYWELVEENSSSCAITPPEEVIQPSLLPIVAVIGGMVLLGV